MSQILLCSEFSQSMFCYACQLLFSASIQLSIQAVVLYCLSYKHFINRSIDPCSGTHKKVRKDDFMTKKLSISIRIQFLIIAVSLAVTTTVLGLSAYLTDTDTYQGTFKTVGGDALGFKLTGNKHEDEVIVPGSTIPLNVVATIEQPNDLFIFVKLEIPSDFALDGFNSIEWHPIKDGSNIYYLGNSNHCVSLGKTNGTSSNVLSGITLSSEAVGGANYTLTVIGYAIQAANIDSTKYTPEQIFNMIEGG